MIKLLAVSALLAATWQTDDIEHGRAQLTFSATIVPTVSVAWDEHWDGNYGIAQGTYSADGHEVAFMVPLTKGQQIILSPDAPSGHRDGVYYAALEDYATEALVHVEK